MNDERAPAAAICDLCARESHPLGFCLWGVGHLACAFALLALLLALGWWLA